MVSPNVYGYAPELAPPPPDRDEARRLLAAAGHGGGLELILELREGQGSPEPIRRQLAEVGVRLALVERPWSEMYPRLQSGVVPFYLGGWVCTSGDASDFLDMKAHSHDPERGYGASNSNRYSDPLLDALVEQAGTMRMEARLEVLKRALRMLAGEHVFIPLYTPSDLYGAREDLRWTPRQDGRIYAFEMERTP
jgi:peptide/nickel transport system substrate-binding protein